jgi:hypothetical protein
MTITAVTAMKMIRRLESFSSRTGDGSMKPPMPVDCTLGVVGGPAARAEEQHAECKRIPNAGEPGSDPGEFHSRLFAAYREPVDAQGGSGYAAAEFQIAGDLGDVEEHLFQISGHGNLFHWISQLAA